MLVVKVGGSLYSLPDLPSRLCQLICHYEDPQWLIIPGGGPTADVVREFHRRHQLSDEVSHWLALRACALNGEFLRQLLARRSMPPRRNVSFPYPSLTEADQAGGVLDPWAFARADEGQLGCLPHCWNATSDSVAARVAGLLHARLVLAKSICLPAHATWDDAAQLGIVDPLFPSLVEATNLSVEVVNLRQTA